MRFNMLVVLVAMILIAGCGTKQEMPEYTEPEPIAETTTTTVQQMEEPKQEPAMADDIRELLDKGKAKLKSYSYSYKGPEHNFDYVMDVKGDKIRIQLPNLVYLSDNSAYNTIYLDTKEKTAKGYCLDCKSYQLEEGMIADLDYDDAYIETPLEWLEKVNEAEKLDSVTVEGRECERLQTNIGRITVENYYGFLYEIRDGEDRWEFTQASFNSVGDADVNPA